MSEELKPCPCGQTPAYLCITPGDTCKWAWVSGSCCSDWHIEMRTDYLPLDDARLMVKAAECWNLAPRPAPVQVPEEGTPLRKLGGVDVEKVMALVEEYGDLMCSVGMNSGQPWARKHTAECMNEADTSLAQIRALLTPANVGWQPIETAPKDGTRILLAKIGATNAVPGLGIKAREPHVWWACTGHWSEKWKNWNDGIEPCGLAGPNYWQPLPLPPAIANHREVE